MNKVPSKTSHNDHWAQRPHKQCVHGELKRHPIEKELCIGGHRKHRLKHEIVEVTIRKERTVTVKDSAMDLDRTDHSSSAGLWFRLCELFSKISKITKRPPKH